MANKDYMKAIAADVAITGKRFCTNCRMSQKPEGGAWIKHSNGLRQRWKCATCVERARHRAALSAETSPETTDGHGADSSINQPAAL